jgi:hypothetical protein
VSAAGALDDPPPETSEKSAELSAELELGPEAPVGPVFVSEKSAAFFWLDCPPSGLSPKIESVFLSKIPIAHSV